MKRTSLAIALTFLSAAPSAAETDSRIAKFCGPSHVNEVASDGDVRSNPAGYYVASLGQQVRENDPRILLTASDEFYLCTRPAATPIMEMSEFQLLMNERRVKYLFVPVMRRGTRSSS